MPSVARSALVSHPVEKMYALVCDVEAYPEFLPWCQAASVAEQSATHQVATVTIDKRMQGIAFTTRNTLEANSAIHMGLIDGPFKQLSGIWRFRALNEEACKVELALDFEFKSRLLARVLGPAFSKICDSMVAAFVKRADQLS